MRRAAPIFAALAVGAGAAWVAASAPPACGHFDHDARAASAVAPSPSAGPPTVGAPSDGCLSCHGAIEEMHPWSKLTCVDCHGGDGKARTAEAAHVRPTKPPAGDERVAPIDEDLPYRRFLNPSDLRVIGSTCGTCHAGVCSDVKKSLHATTAGHLSDGLYENGAIAKRASFAIFPISDDDGVASPHGLKSLPAIGGFAGGPEDDVATHYRDVVRKNCMHCHVWSRGRAVRGRLGMDGDYRSEGCAACHVTYSDAGYSESADRSIDHREPGRPRRHEMTTKVPTDTCVKCHYGDANIGLAFRGLAQRVPGQPAGPDVPGTTSKRQNGAFYLRDDRIAPPDVHHERGMHCIDCHTSRDVMGDGDLLPNMDHAVEIECASCHGDLKARTAGLTARGERVDNLAIEPDAVWLTSKVTGERRRVKQARDVIDPLSPDFNPRAREAMTPEHGALECYACHASWNVNFFGFHFDRNASFTQLDLISGKRTPGRVNTQEKVFATFKQLTLGLNHDGAYAPYLVGFSTFCSAHDAEGRTTIDHGMPRTAAGLSGMTMIHHQPHTVRREARQCVECHRSGEAWGLGSGSFDLTRETAIAGTPRGVAFYGVDRRSLDRSTTLAVAKTAPVRDVAATVDSVSGRFDAVYAATEAGLSVIVAGNPAFPEVVHEIASPGGYSALLAQDKALFAAAPERGVDVFDLKDRRKPVLLARVPCADPRDLVASALRLFVADGKRGLTVIDVADLRNPRVAANLRMPHLRDDGPPETGADVVAAFFQFSRPIPGGGRTRARRLVALGGRGMGLRLVDATEPSRPFLITAGLRGVPEAGGARRVVGLRFSAKYDLGSTGGGIPSFEHDYLYVATRGEGGEGRLLAVRVTEPTAPTIVDRIALDAPPVGLESLKLYSAPFLVHAALVPTDRGLRLVDVTRAEQGVVKGALDGPCSGGVVAEAMPLDRMIDEDGNPLKDVAHVDARYVDGPALRRLLRAPIPEPAPDPQLDPAPAGGGKAPAKTGDAR